MRLRGACAVAVLAVVPACTCSKTPPPPAPVDAAPAAPVASAAAASEPPLGLSAPIAATHLGSGAVVVAGLDVPAKAIRVERIDDKDAITLERTALSDVAWSSEADLRIVPAGAGVAITWRGKRGGKLVRQLVVLDADLAPKGEPVDVTAAACATDDALYWTDGAHMDARKWSGASSRTDLPKDKDASLVCGAHAAYAVLEDDDGVSIARFGGDAGDKSVRLLEDSAFGEDEPRERAEYTAGDDLGVVRLAASGSLALRELSHGVPGPLRRLTTKLSRDADVVAVDASARAVVVVSTEDASASCDSGSSTRVLALRIDRASLEESTVELSPGSCGREVGPFFTGARPGDGGVAVAWVERVPRHGDPRAPIEGLAYRVVPASGAGVDARAVASPPLGRIEQAADALVDAGCDAARCYAVALARKPGMDAMVPGFAKVLRYP
jgi:hypothetical protein